MGCDIHGVIERRVNGQWLLWRTLNHIHTSYPNQHDNHFCTHAALDRNYQRFGELANVRCGGKYTPRGIPGDASESTRYLATDVDWHSHSWLPLKEAADIYLQTEHNKLSDFDRKYPMYHYFGIDDSANIDIDDFRFVFWFDS